MMKQSKHICAATSTGSINLLDTDTLRVIHTFPSSNVTIADMDTRNNLVLQGNVCCLVVFVAFHICVYELVLDRYGSSCDSGTNRRRAHHIGGRVLLFLTFPSSFL